jgi:hypothetical protein
MNIKPRVGRRNYQKGGEVEENPNPWASEDLQEQYRNDPGRIGHYDPRLFDIFRSDRTKDVNVISPDAVKQYNFYGKRHGHVEEKLARGVPVRRR